MSGGNSGKNKGGGKPVPKEAHTEGRAVVELLRIVKPFTNAIKDGPIGVSRLLNDMGIAEDLLGRDGATLFQTASAEVQTSIEQIDKAVSGIVSEVDSVTDIEGLHQIDEVEWRVVFAKLNYADVLANLKSIIKAVKAIFKAIKKLQKIDIQDPDLKTLGEQIVDFLFVRYLKSYYGQVYGYCRLFGVIVEPKGGNGPEEIKLEKIADAFEDPNEIPKELFQWAKKAQPFLAALLLRELLRLMWGANVPAAIAGATENERKQATGQQDLSKLDPSKMDDWGQKLVVPLAGAVYNDSTRAEVGVQVVPLPPAESDDFLPGLALVTYGTLTADMSMQLGDEWKLSVDGKGELANRGVAINPAVDSGLNFSFVNTEQSSNTTPGGRSEDKLAFSIALENVGQFASVKRELVGTLVGGISIKGMGVQVNFEYANDEFEVGIAFNTTGTLSLDPRGGFLDKVIPKPIEYDFDITIGWSSKSGLYLRNGGTLRISIADNISLGPLTIKETFLGLDAGDTSSKQDDDSPPALPVVFSTTPELDLGFLTAQVMRTGVKADLRFPGGNKGNLGPADVDIGFKPPKGIALSVNVGAVSGGGMLRFFPEENRYSGALQLSISSLTLTAVGLLKTELPGGRDGYSFLVLITAEFPPIQLGFGFTLNGVGGMFGLNRGMKTKVLGKKIRAGNVDSILFPEDVVENATRIISDLRSIFPPKTDHHVVGPMVKMGWGSPTMLTMEVGVILELPTFEIAIVGAFHLNMPNEDAAMVSINLAVLGVLDVPDKRLAVTASLYDSRIVLWTISGDMAMRLRWGDDSKFMLSIGGFHPRYDPPKGFPKLDRIRASMSPPGVNASVQLSGYLATTPNTFQVGAGVKAHAEFGPLVIDGQLGFDALFKFNPFKFIIDFLAKFAVEVKGQGLSVKIDGTVMGPGPMRITGTVHVEILMFSITKNVDLKMGSGGDKEEPPRAKVMPKLTTELGKSGNWAAQLPDGADALATVRDSEEGKSKRTEKDSSEVLAHPLGGISVRQTVVPLEEKIETFGNMVPRDFEEFRITSIEVDGNPLDATATREKFAPAKYKKMKDSEKLNAPAFERQPAGKAAGTDRVYFPGNSKATKDRADELRRTARLAYETSVVDEERENYGAPLGRVGGFQRMQPDTARFGTPARKVPDLLENTAVANSTLRDGLLGDEEPVYGVPGGVVVGDRVGRDLPDATVERIPVNGGQPTGTASGPDVTTGGVSQPGADGEGSVDGASTGTDEQVTGNGLEGVTGGDTLSDGQSIVGVDESLSSNIETRVDESKGTINIGGKQ